MSFIADLHTHSHLSRATSKDCTLEGLYYWAQHKGVRVVSTGDFTHPAWFAELKEKLVESGPGLLRLRPEIAGSIDAEIPESCRNPVDFIITGEISSIYKRDNRTRKVHSILLIPDMDTAATLCARLDALGNIKSDGRPILGLDPQILLEITLEANPNAYLIPAHIWTPWFSMLGSKSGFDSTSECFGDLSKHIFAAETGLSSDPPMNWRVSSLDNLCLVSNSDLHSPAKMGRNANIFHCDPDFHIMKEALRTKDRDKFGGTIDLFPEEGKYHLDGHRKCGVCMEPEESRNNDCLCPVCGNPLVLGVLHRVVELADRPKGRKPPSALPCEHIIPLAEILSEIYSCGPQTKKVTRAYFRLVRKFGPELNILRELDPSFLRDEDPPLLDEAIRRVRNEDVIKQPGFDGEYGVIRVFGKGETDKLRHHSLFFNMPEFDQPHPDQKKHKKQLNHHRLKSVGSTRACRQTSADRPARDRARRLAEPRLRWRLRPTYGEASGGASPRHWRGKNGSCRAAGAIIPPTAGQLSFLQPSELLESLTDKQRKAAATIDAPVIIAAGPGTGKTRTLTYRIASLISQHNIDPRTILAVTFTNRAANEMRERLQQLLGTDTEKLTVATFHAFCLQWLRRYARAADLHEDFSVVDQEEETTLLRSTTGMTLREAKASLKAIAEKQRSLADPSGIAGFRKLIQALQQKNMLALDAIIPCFVRLLRENPAIQKQIHYDWICIDEYQDINRAQYELVTLLCPSGKGLCVIGDPDQAIYAFRGSDVSYFLRFTQDFPNAKVFGLSRNFRSSKTIVSASDQVISPGKTNMSVTSNSIVGSGLRIRFYEAASAAAEAEFITHEIEKWLGGTALFSLDSERVTGFNQANDISLNDIAVLVRLRALIQPLAESLTRLGLPVQSIANEPFIEHVKARQVIDTFRNSPGNMLTMQANKAVSEIAREKTKLAQFNEPVKAAFRECCKLADDFHGTLRDFLDHLLLRQGPDCYHSKAEKITIMTLHAAKGLEFPLVFIAGCEDGILPYVKADEETDMDEERRLLYVGMTRASRALYITSARKRSLFGKQRQQHISPFVRKIEESLRENLVTPQRKRPPADRQIEFDLPDS